MVQKEIPVWGECENSHIIDFVRAMNGRERKNEGSFGMKRADRVFFFNIQSGATDFELIVNRQSIVFEIENEDENEDENIEIQCDDVTVLALGRTASAKLQMQNGSGRIILFQSITQRDECLQILDVRCRNAVLTGAPKLVDANRKVSVSPSILVSPKQLSFSASRCLSTARTTLFSLPFVRRRSAVATTGPSRRPPEQTPDCRQVPSRRWQCNEGHRPGQRNEVARAVRVLHREA